MAPNKRRHTEVDNESDEESAPSESQVPTNKRPRTSQSQVNGQSPDPDHENSDVEEANAHYTYTYTSRVDDDNALYLDVSSGDEGEADPDTELRATQMVQQHFQEQKENMPSEHGIIEEVFMNNFMCHGKLRISLGPLINFIVGHNGSGKSAILTALTICLGAKANATNRAANLKNFIKTGEDSAYVSVKLKNHGENAYKPESYGKSIIVERHFSKSGTSGFKIKNSEGKIISNKKAELENIVDFFALQLDNPMNVLSQDMARQFLSNSTPHDKYKFFIKGTQLEALDSDYRIFEEQVDGLEAKCEVREKDIEVLAEKARAASEKKKLIDRSQTIQTKITQLGWQHAWAQVEEQEREVAKIDEEIRKVDDRIATLQAKADAAGRVYEESHQSREAIESVIQDVEAAKIPIQENYDGIKQLWEHNKSEMLNRKTEQRRIKEDIRGAQNTMHDLQNKIDTEHQRIEDANGPAHARKITDLDAAKTEHQQCTQHEEQLGSRRMQLSTDCSQAENEVRSAKPALAQKRQAIQEAELQLSSLESDQGQQMRSFHPTVLNVLRAIKNERGFRAEVAGPMGLHVRLLKPEWGSVIETTFGGQMDAFVVTNSDDQKILSRIMRQQNCHSNIAIVKPGFVDSSANEPDQGLDTILRVLEIDHNNVRTALIMQNGIDQTVLIPERDEANAFAQSRPMNVRATICHNTHARGAGWRYETTRGGGIRMGPVRKWNRIMRMKTSAEAQINMAKENIAAAKREYQEVENRIRALDMAANRAKQALNRHDREAKETREKKQRLEDRIEMLQGELDRDAANDTGTLDELHSQYEDAQGSLKSAEDTFQDSVNALDQLGNEQRGVKQQLDAASRAVEEAKTKIQKAKDRLANKATEREFALRRKNEALNNVDVAKGDKEQHEQRREAQVKTVSEYTELAEGISRRVTVEPGNTVEVLDKKLEALCKERDLFQQRVGGDREQIYEQWRTAHKVFGAAQKELNETRDTAKKLKATLLNRKGRWKLFRKYITTRAKITFGYLLAERNFRGRILVNHADKMLDINVEPDISKSSDRGRQTKTLSGGEKSFSTICLLLSIWEAMGSPIRCLDEFDVFMDSANREVSMKMMIQAARRSVGRQFVLITPQAMGKYTEGLVDVHVHKMADPERGQTTLNFGTG